MTLIENDLLGLSKQMMKPVIRQVSICSMKFVPVQVEGRQEEGPCWATF